MLQKELAKRLRGRYHSKRPPKTETNPLNRGSEKDDRGKCAARRAGCFWMLRLYIIVENALPISLCCFCVSVGNLTAVIRCKMGQQEEISGNTDPIFYGLFIFEGERIRRRC